jgi:PAS domain S-box-containing protein
LLLLAVFTILLALIINVTLTNSKLKDIYTVNQEKLTLIDHIIGELLHHYESDLKALSLNELVTTREDAEFTNFLNADENTFQYNIGELEQSTINLMNNYRISNDYVNSVYMGRENGSFVRSHPRAEPTQYDPRERPWYIAAKENPSEVVITEPYKSVTTDDINIGFEKALVDESGVFFGVIGVDVTLTNLSDLLLSFSTQNDAELMLVSDKDVILATNRQELLFSDIASFLDEESIQTLHEEKGSFYTEDDYFIFNTASRLNWKIVSIISRDSINASTRRTIFLASVYFISVFAIYGFIEYFILNKIFFSPIYKLEQEIEHIHNANSFSELSYSERQDEIGSLSKSVNNFMAIIKQQQNDLLEFNKNLEKEVQERTRLLEESNLKLKQSEEKYKNVVEDSVYKIFRWKKDGTIVFANLSMRFGDERIGEDIEGKNLYSILQPEIAENVKNKISQLTPEVPTIENESHYQGLDGNWHWEEWIERGIFDNDGNLIEIQSTGKDISELKKANEVQRKLSSAIQYSPVTVVITDLNGNIEYVNPMFEKVTGYSFKEAIGKNPSVLKSGFHSDDFYKKLWKTITSGNIWNGEFTNKKKNGELFYESASIAPIQNEIGNITHFVAVKEDITAKRESQAALRESEKRLQDILKYAPILVNIHDLKGRYIYINDEFAKILEKDRDEILNKTDYDLFPREMADLLAARTEEVKRTKKVNFYNSEYKIDGEVSYFKDIMIPLINEEGDIYAICGWSWDVTDLTNLNIEMDKARMAAEDASHAKSRFVATMSHEIRTPLNAISGLIYLLEKTKLDEKQKNMLTSISSASSTLMNIINDILDFSKIEAGKLDIENIEFDLTKELDKLASVIGFKAQGKGLDFNIQVDPEIPFMIVGDPVRLNQILTNLAGNAVKFTEKGEIFIKIDVVKKIKNIVSIKFSVIDTGIGISKESQKKLFSPFVQAENSITRNYGGTGLGLTISQLLAEKMGGSLSLDSSLGEGSTFSFQLDFGIVKCKSPKTIPENFADLRVFIVEKSEHSLTAVSNIFTSFSIENKGVPSCDKALEYITSENFKDDYDLMIINIEVSGGPDLPHLKEILKNKLFDPSKIIALVNVGKEQMIDSLEGLGITMIIFNPATHSAIFNTLQSLITKDGKKIGDMGIKDMEKSGSVLKDIHILIVEDNEINQIVASQLLESMGATFDIANDGKEAIEAVKKNTYDVVLMDIQMPVMDGIQATAYIRKELEMVDLPIIALTADVTTEIKEKLDDAGANDFLQKPINVDEFQQKIAKYACPRGGEKKDE